MVKNTCNIFITLAPGVDLIKLFWYNFNQSFCKLDLFIAMQQIMFMLINWSRLQKSVSKFMTKLFYEIDPRARCYKTFTDVIHECSY